MPKFLSQASMHLPDLSVACLQEGAAEPSDWPSTGEGINSCTYKVLGTLPLCLVKFAKTDPSIHPSVSTERGSRKCSVERRAYVMVTIPAPRLASAMPGTSYFGRASDASCLTLCARFVCAATAARHSRPQSSGFLISNPIQANPINVR